MFELYAESQDELEKRLVEMQALIGSSLALHRNRSIPGSLIARLRGNSDDVLRKVRELITGARHSIDIIHAAGPPVSEQAAHLFQGEPGLLGAVTGEPVRLLTLPHLLDADEFVRVQQVRGEYSVEIRLTRVPPLRVVIIDNRAVLSEAGPAEDRRVTLITVPEVVHAISTLFQGAWGSAAPASHSIIFDDCNQSALARRILDALGAGVPDEVAARELNVSVRTYGRHVAELMSVLGASSRFQAGVRAAEAGLLMPSTG